MPPDTNRQSNPARYSGFQTPPLLAGGYEDVVSQATVCAQGTPNLHKTLTAKAIDLQ